MKYYEINCLTIFLNFF